MKLVALIDSVALERELLERLERAHADVRKLDRTLLLLPTRRLAAHLERRLLERRPAWLGLELLTFGGLVRRLLAFGERAPLAVASPLLLEALLTRCLHADRENLWSRHARRRPGTVGPLGAALRDLREAAIEPHQLEQAVDGSEAERDLSRIYTSYSRALDELAREGRCDEAGLAAASLPKVVEYASRYRRIFVYGAYEFLGIYQRVLRELNSFGELALMLPIQAGAPASAYAEHHARTFLEADFRVAAEPCAAHDDARRRRLAQLYDERAGEQIEASPRLRCRHAQGAATEIGTAVREALAAVRDGVDPREIAIVARNLEPYAAAIEQSLEDAGLSWCSSLSSPLRRRPVVRDFLLLLTTVRDDFPTDATLRLLHARGIDWGDGDLPQAATIERLALEAGLLGGLTEWRTLLPSFVNDPSRRPGGMRRSRETERSQALALASRLERLADALPPGKSRWSQQAERFGKLLHGLFPAGDDPAHARLASLIETMAEQQRLLGDDAPASLGDAIGWLERAVAGTTLQLQDDDRGIRVLDLMQARGLTFRRIHWVGMNSGLYPRRVRREPILGEALRERLVRATGRPLTVESPEGNEEHLLLSLVIGSAIEQIDFSWQRAGEAGRAMVPSLALREVARIATGRPDMQAWIVGARHIPSHPAQMLQNWLGSSGLLEPGEERLLAALRSTTSETQADLIDRFPELGPGLRMLQATQSFESNAGAFDGRLASGAQALTLSVSQLEQLGNCPLRYFFSAILRLRALEKRASPTRLATNELGTQIHQSLQRIYEQLEREKLFDAGEPTALVRRGLELLEDSGDELFGELYQRLAARLPLLWRSQEAQWRATLRRFVREDLQRIGAAGQRPLQFEQLLERELDFDDGVRATLRGKFDRVFVGPDGIPVIGDYKVTTSLAQRVDRGAMLKGRSLQLPVYQRMLETPARVELMAIHPGIEPDDDDRRVAFDGFDDTQEPAFKETMRVLLSLLSRGVFPFRSDRHCAWCEFQLSCRRLHPPSQEREQNAADSAAYRQLASRSSSKPHGR